MPILYNDTLASGTKFPTSFASFPGAYTDSTPGIVFNLYNGSDPRTYVAPGPPVSDLTKSGFVGLVGVVPENEIGES